MPSPVSHVLQAAMGKVRFFLLRAVTFWRGAAAIAVAVFAALLVVAFTVPEVYQSDAVISYTQAGGQAQDDAAVAERLHAAFLDPRTLERVARGLMPELGSGNAGVSGEAIERIRQSIDVRPGGNQKIAISFRAASAAYAQHGCQELAQLAGQYLDAMTTAASPAAEESAKRAKALEEKTRELAEFVATHPEVAMNRADDAAKSPTGESASAPAASSGRTTSSAPTDTAVVVLQQERAKLEARLAAAEKQKEASARGEGNPYDPPAEDDPESLRQMIAQVKSAITARQNAVARGHHDDSSGASAEKKAATSAASAASSSPALRSEWQRLVQALLEAQRDQPAKRDVLPSTRIVQAASFPSAPIKPNRPVLALVGLASGLWMGVLWALARVALGHDQAVASSSPTPAPPVVATKSLGDAATMVADAAPPIAPTPVVKALPPAEANPAFAATVAVPEPATPVESFVEESPAPRAATPSTPPTKQQFWRPPLRLRVTQRGVIDLAAVLAQTGSAAASSMGPGVAASPIVGVGDGSEAAPEVAGPTPRPPSELPVRAPSEPPVRALSEPPPPAEPIAAQPESVVPRRPAPLPNARTLVGHLAPEDSRGESPVRPRSEPPARAQSEPPARPRSDPPPRARSDPPARPRSDPPPRARSDPPARPRSDPPARPRSDPPARPRSDPPVGPRSEPPEQQRARSDVPDGVIALRDVPSGWSPDPSIGGTDSVEEFRAIREQLYRFAVRGCFVVGVSSSPEAIDGKSRIAARLATVLAEPQRARVLLMEGDFDGPAVHRLMRIDMPFSSGFSEQVRRRMKGPNPAPWAIVRCSPSLQVLAEGRVRAPGLLSSVQFMDGLSELRRYYDVIVLDGPTAGSVDARVLDEICDGLVVVGPNEAAMPEIRRKAAQWFSKKGWMATLPAVTGQSRS